MATKFRSTEKNTLIEQLIEHVDELAGHLKLARKDLNTALEETELYGKLLASTLKHSPTGCTMPEKAAKAHALKVTLANFTKTEEEA